MMDGGAIDREEMCFLTPLHTQIQTHTHAHFPSCSAERGLVVNDELALKALIYH